MAKRITTMIEYAKDIKEEKDTLVNLLNTIHRQVHACVSYVNSTPERCRVNRTDILKIKNFELKLIQKLSELSVELHNISEESDQLFYQPEGNTVKKLQYKKVPNVLNTSNGQPSTGNQNPSNAVGASTARVNAKQEKPKRQKSQRVDPKYMSEALKLVAEKLGFHETNASKNKDGTVASEKGNSAATAVKSCEAAANSSSTETEDDYLVKIHRYYATQPTRVVETFRDVTEMMGLDQEYLVSMMRYYSNPFLSEDYSSDDDYDSDDSSDSLV